MSAVALAQQFLLDAEGKRVGVVLDIATYERLLEAAEDQRDIDSFDRVAEDAAREFAAGECITAEQLRSELRTRDEAAGERALHGCHREAGAKAAHRSSARDG